jgi:hypothetical protein
MARVVIRPAAAWGNPAVMGVDANSIADPDVCSLM